MPLSFLFDENIPLSLRTAHVKHNASTNFVFDVVFVGAPPDLPRGADDSDILRWAERENRIVVTVDESTMPEVLWQHLNAGRHCPGILIVRPRSKTPDIIDHLAQLAYASEAWEWQDRIEYIP